MEFPVWFIPGLSKGVIIGLVSVLHVFVAQFAVGGGIYLVWMEKKAHEAENAAIKSALLDWLHRHTYFFLLLTMVFGGLSGVGIWFTMTVTNPSATASLINIFLWIWASEWVFFLVEIVALLVYYYTYPIMRSGKMKVKTHMQVGAIYAFSAFMSLVIITGVIGFMLTPGTGLENQSLAQAYFNPSYFPSLVFRTALCLMLAGMFALFTSSRVKMTEARRKLMRANAFWVLIPFAVLLLSSVWYFYALPMDRQAAILRRTADIRPFALSYGWILALIFVLGVLALARAEKLRTPFTVAVLCSGLALVGSFESIRETGRRPWIIPDYMYSSTVRLDQTKDLEKYGIASHSGWVRYLEENEARVGSGEKTEANTSLAAVHARSGKIKIQKGELIFAQQCGTCHAVGGPRLNIVPLITRFAPEGIVAQVRGQGVAPLDYMPPFYGNEKDLKALASYLNGLRKTGI